ncbi:DUF2244 domain-containing protein [Bowmanella denitrificans]|uniref:DUF2244 domain-containing protein n=1 Tax=Bowmanella denitrificans TaxID=366582 RepID=UPI000C9B8999|nr:DUF2244 domain-containing protein [Bowmanella denitrificans]
MVSISHRNGVNQICLRPNRSASWSQTKWLISGLSCVAILVALAWSLAGAWLILPFAGLEVALLAALAFKVCKYTYHQQVIKVSAHCIDVQWGQHYPKRRWQFPRENSLILVEKARHSLSGDRLVLLGNQQRLPIGEYLNQDDQRKLLSALRDLHVPITFRGQNSIVAMPSEPETDK